MRCQVVDGYAGEYYTVRLKKVLGLGMVSKNKIVEFFTKEGFYLIFLDHALKAIWVQNMFGLKQNGFQKYVRPNSYGPKHVGPK